VSASPVAARTAEELNLELYRRMATIREFEEAAYRSYESGEITGTIHASIGQEAVAVGVMSALRPVDKVLTHHRGHGHALAKGVDPARLFAELLGRAGGVSGGKGGSMHATDVSVGFLGSLAVVGSSIPLAVGVALAARRRGDQSIAVVFFGDGAVNQGVLYESLNLAAIWDLPVLFVCENNRYAISVASDYATSGSGLVARAHAFGARAEQVDGQSVLDIRRVAAELVGHARAGAPAVLEALTYRLVGHSRGDPAHGLYRTRDEVDEWRARDPLVVHADAAAIAADERAALTEQARATVQQAIAEGRRFEAPAPERVESDVWGR
jgi:acetoin:2,6-dichlorophenolindophenol oxidoreductase subunit alpha